MGAVWATYAALGVVALVMAAALLAPWLAPYAPNDLQPDLLAPPSGRYLFGTDDLGRDILSRVIHGASVSVLVGVIAMGTAATPPAASPDARRAI